MLLLTYIYALLEPDSDEIRYIGKSNDPWKRVSGHVLVAKKETHHRANWIHTLAICGLRPQLEIIAEVPVAEWEFWERHYIKYFRDIGFRLTNSAPGGEGLALPGESNPMFGRVHSKETRAKISAAVSGVNNVHLGTTRSPKAIALTSAANTGRKPSNATSKFHNVSLRKATNNWQAGVNFGGKHFYLGVFKVEEDAARAADVFVRSSGLSPKFLNFS